MFDSPLPPNQTAADQGKTQMFQRRVFLVVVDASDELHAALRFASQRARNTGGRVALLSVTQPPEFQHWMFVGNLMQEEARLEGEQRLHQAAATVHSCSGDTPELFLREGDAREELFKLVSEDDGISVVVLAAGTGKDGPGPLVEALTGKHAGMLRVPVTIVPGDLSDDEIDGLT